MEKLKTYFQQLRKVLGEFFTALYIGVLDTPRKPFIKWLWRQAYILIPLFIMFPIILMGIMILAPVLADDSWDVSNY